MVASTELMISDTEERRIIMNTIFWGGILRDSEISCQKGMEQRGVKPMETLGI